MTRQGMSVSQSRQVFDVLEASRTDDRALKGQTLGKRVREELRTAIMAGRFHPGQKLTIRAVAAALQVSLTPAREALYNLAAEGALEMAANGTVRVPALTEARIVELTKIRMALEGLAAREAAVRFDDGQVAEAERLHKALLKADARADYASVIDLNWRFHFLIYAASGMPQLLKMIEGCWMQMGSYQNIIYPDYGKSDTGVRNHDQMFAALAARDAERLCAAVCRDIEFATASLSAKVRAWESRD